MDNRKPEDGAIPEKSQVEKPEQGLIEDRDLVTISGGGIVYTVPSPPEV
jgi:hypothetical protein